MQKIIYNVEKGILLQWTAKMQHGVKNLWNTISYLGIQTDYNRAQIERIRYLNQFAIFNTPNFLITTIFYYLIGLHFASFVMFLNLLSIPVILYLNHKKYHEQSTLVMHLLSSFSIFAASCSLGSEMGIQYFYLPNLASPHFLFAKEKIRFRYVATGSSFLMFIMGEMSHYSIWKTENYSDDLTQAIRIISFSLSVILLFHLIILSQKISLTEESMEKEEKKFLEILKNEVSERQKIEESWSNAVQLQAEIMNCIPANALVLDKTGSIIRFNHFSEPFPKENISQIPHFGMGSNFIAHLEEIYKNCQIYIPEFRESLKSLLEGRTHLFEKEFIFTGKFQKPEWYILRGNHIQNDFFEGAFLLHTNITEKKQTEKNLQKTKKINIALQNSLPDLMFNVAEDGLILDFHADKSSSLYMISDLMVGKNLKDFEIPQNIIAEILKTISQVLQSGNSHKIRYQLEHKGKSYTYDSTFVQLDKKEALALVKRIPLET